MLIGEIYLPIERLVTYYGGDLRGAQLPFNFQLLHTAWTAAAVGKLVTDYEALCHPAAGRTGFWETTISRVSRRASAKRRRALPPCCC